MYCYRTLQYIGVKQGGIKLTVLIERTLYNKKKVSRTLSERLFTPLNTQYKDSFKQLNICV